MKLNCVVCRQEANYICEGFTLCERHFKQSVYWKGEAQGSTLANMTWRRRKKG